jgi:hypothetical protein
MKPEQAFYCAYKGQQNFMTPRREQPLAVQGEFVYEIASGTGMRGKPIFGVSVVRLSNGERMPKLNGLFDSLADAREYVADNFQEVAHG